MIQWSDDGAEVIVHARVDRVFPVEQRLEQSLRAEDMLSTATGTVEEGQNVPEEAMDTAENVPEEEAGAEEEEEAAADQAAVDPPRADVPDDWGVDAAVFEEMKGLRERPWTEQECRSFYAGMRHLGLAGATVNCRLGSFVGGSPTIHWAQAGCCCCCRCCHCRHC